MLWLGRDEKWFGQVVADGGIGFLCRACDCYVRFDNLAVVDYGKGHVCCFCTRDMEKRDMEVADKQRQEGGE